MTSQCEKDAAGQSAQPEGARAGSGLPSRWRLPGLLLSVVGVAVVFCMQAQYRNHLVPRHADYDRRRVLLTGDEPSYILMAQAIAGGHGLNVRPIIESGAYRRFYSHPVISPEQDTWSYYFGSGWIVPALDRSSQWQAAQKMQFTPLLPLFMAPYVDRVECVRWLTGLLQSILTGLLFWALMRPFLHLPAQRVWVPAFGMAALFGGIPVGYYTTQLYPEILGGAAVLAAGALALAGGARFRIAALVLQILALLATPRTAPVVLALQLFMLLDACRSDGWRKSLLLVAGSSAVWGCFVLFALSVWGTFFPPMGSSFLKNFLFAGATQGGSVSGLLLQRASSLAQGVLRVLFGRDIGLVFLCPITLWSIVLAVRGWKVRGQRRASCLWALMFAGSVVSVALYPEFRAGSCPAGRFQVIPAFLCALPILAAARPDNAPFTRPYLATFLWLVAVTVVLGLCVGGHPGYWFRAYHPLFGYRLLQPYYGWLPAFEHGVSMGDLAKAVLWASVFLLPMLLAGVGRRQLRSPPFGV